MIDAISNIHQIQLSQLGMGTNNVQPNPQDVIDFENALKEETHDIQFLQKDEGIDSIHPNKEEGIDSISNMLMDTIENYRVTSKEHLQEINNQLKQVYEDGLEPQELIHLQLKLFQFTHQTQVTTKIAEKANDGIETLFRQQG